MLKEFVYIIHFNIKVYIIILPFKFTFIHKLIGRPYVYVTKTYILVSCKILLLLYGLTVNDLYTRLIIYLTNDILTAERDSRVELTIYRLISRDSSVGRAGDCSADS